MEQDDGRRDVKEVFIDMRNDDELVRGLLNALARVMSIGLQYQVPAEEYVDAMKFTNFAPHGPVRDHAKIKHCTSVLDLLARELGITFCGNTELAHIKDPVETKATISL